MPALGAVTLWGATSLLSNRTVVPRFTTRSSGSNFRPSILTEGWGP
jgi:hypothetical protein